MSKIQDKMLALQNAIFQYHYYVNLYEEVLKNNSVTKEDISERKCHDRDIVKICNEFWEALPDSPSIRRFPFFDLCDIAEYIFED